MVAEVDHGREWLGVAPAIWQIVNLAQPYPWAVGPTSRKRLADLVPPDEFSAVFATDDSALINRHLRSTLAPRLAGRDRTLAAAVACWVVRSWGGIKGGPQQTIVDWSDALGRYGGAAVNDFIERHRDDRISSWSKLLAFADHANHAIYDARTAVALNCALAALQDSRRFHMPASQNRRVFAARRKFLQEPNFEARGYRDYLNLLTCFVVMRGAADLLSAEMTLFANAPNVAEAFVSPKS